MLKIEMTFESVEDAADILRRIAGPSTFEGVLATVNGEGTSDTAVSAETGAAPRKRRTKAELEAARAAEGAASAAASDAQHEASAGNATDFLDEEPTGCAISDTPEDRKEPESRPLSKEEAEVKFKNEVRPALGRVMQTKGQDHARKVLNDFGYQKITEVPSERYDAFIAVCAKAA